MRLVHPKSLVVGLLLLSYVAKSLFAALPQAHTDALHKFIVVAFPLLAAFCLWHAFRGQKPVPGKSELRTSVILGMTSLLLGLLFVFRPRVHFEPAAIVVGTLYLLAAVYYLRTALQERQSLNQIQTS